MKSETSSHTEETSLVVGVKLLYTGHQAVEIEVPGSLGKKTDSESRCPFRTLWEKPIRSRPLSDGVGMFYKLL